MYRKLVSGHMLIRKEEIIAKLFSTFKNKDSAEKKKEETRVNTELAKSGEKVQT